jgi:transcription elongation factor Elf1
MPIQPKPYKLVCPKCGYTKIVAPKSDASLMIEDLSSCPKCEVRMEIKYSDWEVKK